MSDLISRQDAIDAIDEIDWYHQNRNKDMVSGANSDDHQAWFKSDDVYKALEQIPSAQPERKSGEWIDTEFLKLKECSCCHSRWGMYDVENFDFCPNCGARMTGGE